MNETAETPSSPGPALPPPGFLRRNSWLIAAIVLAAGLGLWFAISSRSEPEFEAPVSAGPRETGGFALPDLDGKEVRLADYADQVVVLDFWASWCGPCRMAMPAVARFSEMYAQRGVKVLSINLRETPAQVRAFLSGHPSSSSMRVLLDRNGAVGTSYGVAGIPTFVVIDRQGGVARKIAGLPANLESVLASLVEPLL